MLERNVVLVLLCSSLQNEKAACLMTTMTVLPNDEDMSMCGL